IIHRDIKPANILIKNGIYKIADFGFAQGAEAGNQSQYNVGRVLYMAPESLLNNQYYFKSDIWALGVLFYELLYKSMPFQADTEEELIKLILQQKLYFPIYPYVSDECKEFIIKCLQIDINKRANLEELKNHVLIKEKKIQQNENEQ
ncbi:protein kinase domain protein, partial [Ichthyophthirius multifiliis]